MLLSPLPLPGYGKVFNVVRLVVEKGVCWAISSGVSLNTWNSPWVLPLYLVLSLALTPTS